MLEIRVVDRAVTYQVDDALTQGLWTAKDHSPQNEENVFISVGEDC